MLGEKTGKLYRRDDPRQWRAGGGDSARAVSIVIGGDKAKIAPAAQFLNDVAQTIIGLPEPWMPKAFKIAIILYATTNNIITAEICSWLTAQGADPKLFLQLLQSTGSQASASRMEEFMKRNNNDGGALSNSYKDFRQALKHCGEAGDSDAAGVDGQSDSGNGPRHGFAAFE